MKQFLIVALAALGFSLAAYDAEAAKRLGGGRNIGQQRDVSPQQARPPVQQQQQQAAPGTQPQQQPAAGNKWLGPLAGLALGAGLAALFMNNGIAGALGGILMILAVVAVAVFLFRMFRRGQGSQNRPQYAGAGYGGEPPQQPQQEPALRRESTPISTSGAAAPHSVAATLSSTPTPASTWPVDFDAIEFVKNAKQNFARLQDANDRGDLDTLREVLTQEMFVEVEKDVRTRWGTPQRTEIVSMDATVIDVVTEAKHYVVSVRFVGLIREDNATNPEPCDEVWHLQKPVDGSSGWVVAGIQQNNS